MSQIPNQAIPISQKDEDWVKDTVNSILDISAINTTGKKYLLKTYYDAYTGNIDISEYAHLMRPWGKNFDNFPAKLTNWNILKPVIDRLAGEKIQRPFIYQVTAVNSDIESLKEEQVKEEATKSLYQMFINELNRLGYPTNQPSEEVKTPKQVEDFVNTNYKDQRAILGQQAMDYIVSYNEFIEKNYKGFLDFMISGEVYTYRGIEHDEPIFNIVNPLEIDFHRDPNKDYIEDGDWVIHYTLMTPGTVQSKFYDDPKLTEDIIDEFENPVSPIQNYPFSIYTNTSTGQSLYSLQRLIPVVHVVWQSKQKVGLLKFIDEFGVEQEDIVTEEYSPNEGEQIEWIWVNQPWECYKVYDKYYFRARPIPECSLSKNNISLRKLPYNGRMYSNRNSDNISLISIGLPYQVTYNIYKYRYELMIAKAKGIIGVFDLQAMPADWELEKWLHYIESMNMMIVDYSDKEKSNFNPTQKSEIDMSLGNFIDKFEVLLASIRSEWESLCGVTKQRQGQISANELVGNVEAAIYQSSAITEKLFADYSNLERRDLQYLIDLSQICWVNGKKASFITHDARRSFLDADGPAYANSEYSVFVNNTSKEYRKLELARNNAQAFIQNGLGASAALEILDSDNFAEIKKKVADAELAMQQLNNQLEAAKRESAEAIEDKITERELNKQEFEREQKQLDRNTKIEVATIQALGFGKAQDVDNDGELDLLEIRKLALAERDQNLKERKQITDETFKQEELKLKAKQLNKPKNK